MQSTPKTSGFVDKETPVHIIVNLFQFSGYRHHGSRQENFHNNMDFLFAANPVQNRIKIGVEGRRAEMVERSIP